jgi:hypothetical protein
MHTKFWSETGRKKSLGRPRTRWDNNIKINWRCCRPAVLNMVLASTTVLSSYRTVLFQIFINPIISSRHFMPVLAGEKENYYSARWWKLKFENLCFRLNSLGITWRSSGLCWHCNDYSGWVKPGDLKMTAVCYIASCVLVEVDRRFRGAYCLHHQGPDDGLCSPPWEPEISPEDLFSSWGTINFCSISQGIYLKNICHLSGTAFSKVVRSAFAFAEKLSKVIGIVT